MFWRRNGCDILSSLSSLYVMCSYVGIICAVDVRRKQSFDRSVRRLEFYGCSVEGRWRQPRHSACPSLLPVWTNANRGCLTTELLISVSTAWHALRSALHISQNDPPRSIQMDLVLNVFYPVFSDRNGKALLTPASRTLLQFTARIWKWICKTSALLVHLPWFRTALTSHNSVSRRVLLQSDLFSQVRII